MSSQLPTLLNLHCIVLCQNTKDENKTEKTPHNFNWLNSFVAALLDDATIYFFIVLETVYWTDNRSSKQRSK